MQRNMKWRIARIASAVALILVAIPYAVTAQNAIVSSTVSGQLNEQFAKHYLGLQVIDPMQPVEINMAYDPQDSLPLDQNSGMYVFAAGNFNRYTNGVPASETAYESSDLETVDGIKRKSIDYGADVASTIVTLVVYNDSTTSLSYTLTGTNVRFVDDSGNQVVAGSTPAPAATATPASTPAPAATATQAAPAPTAMAAGVKSTWVRGTLSEQFAKHYLGVEVIDTAMPATIKMAYDPQDSPTLDAGSGFYLFTESGFKQYTAAVPPSQSAHKTSHQETTDGVKQKAADITSEDASKIVTLVTYNDTTTPISYTLTGTNVKFIDESGTQVEGDRMAAPAPAAQPTTAAATPAAGTPAAATPVPAGTDITPGTTYTVQTGDTLGTISSRAYGSNAHWSSICNANSLADCNHIEVGAVLNIPTLAQTGVQQPGATPAATADAMTPEPTADAMTPEPTSEAMPEPTADTSPGVGNIIEVAEDYEDLDILLLALDLAGLSSTITDGGPYTIFAPTNAAFASLPETRLDTLMADSALLAETLRYHVVSGTLTSSDLVSQTSLTTLEGSTISITSENGTLKVEGVIIVTSDVTASNGVIHFINELLPEPETDNN